MVCVNGRAGECRRNAASVGQPWIGKIRCASAMPRLLRPAVGTFASAHLELLVGCHLSSLTEKHLFDGRERIARAHEVGILDLSLERGLGHGDDERDE